MTNVSEQNQSASGLKVLLDKEILRCLKLAETRYGRAFPVPTISYDLRGKSAGVARPVQWHIRLNPKYFKSHPRETVEQTVPHELAHLIDYALHLENFERSVNRAGKRRKRRSLHGPTWKAVMRLFGVEPRRTHTMGLPRLSARHGRRFIYQCPHCKYSVPIVPKAHALLQSGRGLAHLKRCGHVLVAKDYSGQSI